MIAAYGTKISKARSKTPITKQPPDSVGYVGTTEVFRFANSLLTVREQNEQITYTEKRPGERWAANMCRHLKYGHYYTGDATETRTAHHNSVDEHIDHGGHHSGSYTSHLLARSEAAAFHGVNYGVPLPLETYEAYVNRAAELIKPDLTELSIPNFIFELRDLKSLVSLWKRRYSWVQNLGSATLNLQFGVLPTIGDVTRMIQSVDNTSRALDRHQRLAGKRQTRNITLLDEVVSGTGEFVPFAGSEAFWSSTVRRKVECYIVYTPQAIPGYGSFATEVRARLDALGFELNPAIIWNAIPFTFLFDWFINIGKWLDRFKLDTLELPILWSDSFCQYKEEYVLKSHYSHDSTSPSYSPGFLVPAWVSHHTFFERAIAFPEREVLGKLGWGFPSLNQAALIVLLGGSKPRRR